MMAAIWASVAVGVVTRVKEPSGVWWKSLKGGGGMVGRGGVLRAWCLAVTGLGAGCGVAAERARSAWLGAATADGGWLGACGLAPGCRGRVGGGGGRGR